VPVPTFIARRLPQNAYSNRIAKGLDAAYRAAEPRPPVELGELRAVVFSDHHRGKGDGADDFRRCEEAYAAALGWYLEKDYELWLLGDVEELWENRPVDVMKRYENVLALEGQFGERLWRFYGNHDMAWQHDRNADKDLVPHVPGTRVREALQVVITDDGQPLAKLFLVHGHQGTIDSGNLLVAPFSRFVVRHVWAALQRARGFANTSPANDAVLRGKHDRAMASWADRHPERIVLVAGHTHRPVFPGKLPPNREIEAREADREYRSALSSGRDLPAARAGHELARVRVLREEPHDPIELERPSYFNSGCCSFGDGDVTALEFSEGKVRLVRWLDKDGRPTAHELAGAELRTMFGRLSGQAPTSP
jgi:UDP-2,3-diacylglucosamine pyrophosphatase LpxH